MAQAAEAAVRQGLNELCITDHVDTLYWDDFRPRWDFDWDEARRQFREAQALWGDRITLRLGAEYYLTKPCQMDALLERMRAALERGGAHGHVQQQ